MTRAPGSSPSTPTSSSPLSRFDVTSDIIVADRMFHLLQVISTVAAACVMDRLGRRILLCVSAFFMMISISLLGSIIRVSNMGRITSLYPHSSGMYFYIADTEHDAALAHQLSILPVVSLSLFVSMFSIGKSYHPEYNMFLHQVLIFRFWTDSLAHDVRAFLSRGDHEHFIITLLLD